MVVRSALGVCALLAVAAAGCGGSDTAAPTPVEVDGADYAYVMPDEIKGGVVAMHFRNTGKEPHQFAFVRIDGGHTLDDVLAASEKGGDDPPWLTDIGGPPLLTPGAEITITRTLEPGTYAFMCSVPNTKGVRHVQLGMKRQFTVAGDSGAKLPEPNAVITAENKRFDIPDLKAGQQTIELRNASSAGRGFFLGTLNPGKTEADAGRWFGHVESAGRLPATPAPVTFLGAMQTIPSGTSVFLTVNLEAGRSYHISDDESGIQADFTPR